MVGSVVLACGNWPFCEHLLGDGLVGIAGFLFRCSLSFAAMRQFRRLALRTERCGRLARQLERRGLRRRGNRRRRPHRRGVGAAGGTARRFRRLRCVGAAPEPAPPSPPELIMTMVPLMNTPAGLIEMKLPLTFRDSDVLASSTIFMPAFRWISVPASTANFCPALVCSPGPHGRRIPWTCTWRSRRRS